MITLVKPEDVSGEIMNEFEGDVCVLVAKADMQDEALLLNNICFDDNEFHLFITYDKEQNAWCLWCLNEQILYDQARETISGYF